MSTGAVTRGWIGKALPRAEDERFLKGEARYVGDLRRPGMLHAAFVRSVYAHAVLQAVETEAALAATGVRAVLTADDFEGLTESFPVVAPPGAEVVAVAHPVLARGRVRYVGEPVSLVVADTAEQAADAAELVGLELEELPA
ncbi:MAG: xanthine dehydrogenase family protein molybdopterin-binding subunit, partial [Gaiellaceae bacterium]